jgi:hypothetical protein
LSQNGRGLARWCHDNPVHGRKQGKRQMCAFSMEVHGRIGAKATMQPSAKGADKAEEGTDDAAAEKSELYRLHNLPGKPYVTRRGARELPLNLKLEAPLSPRKVGRRMWLCAGKW